MICYLTQSHFSSPFISTQVDLSFVQLIASRDVFFLLSMIHYILQIIVLITCPIARQYYSFSQLLNAFTSVKYYLIVVWHPVIVTVTTVLHMYSSTVLSSIKIFSPELMLQLIEKYKVTGLISASHQMVLTVKCAAMATTDLSSVRHFIVGGSKVPLESSMTLQKYLPNGLVLNVYGMSEIFGLIAMNVLGVENEAVGQLVHGARVKIVDDDGNRLGIDRVGEVCVEKGCRFGGYYGDQERTNALYDAEGFLRTGDTGRFDQDGWLYLVDRKKDIIKYRNYMISPSEIESFLLKCPEIALVCVVGIKDLVSTDLPAAVVVRQKNSTISAEEISAMVAEAFADSRKLRGGVYFVDSLPVTPSGKLIRREVKTQATKLYEQKSINQTGI